jgi:2-hydroxychromene-2-carboxylate isomerase
LAARIALAGEDQPWIAAFVREVYLANFRDDRQIAEPAVLRDALSASGCPSPDALLEAAGSGEIRAGLRARGEAAQTLGVFGAPTFRAGDELFWGADRLDEAVEWAARS